MAERRIRRQLEVLDKKAGDAIALEEASIEAQESLEVSGPDLSFHLSLSTWNMLASDGYDLSAPMWTDGLSSKAVLSGPLG